MSFKKNETSLSKVIESKRSQSPADTPRQSEDQKSSFLSMKNMTNPDDLNSGIFSNKKINFSNRFKDEKGLKSPYGLSERFALMEVGDERNQNFGITWQGQFESFHNMNEQINKHDYFENLRLLKYKKKMKMLPSRKKIKKPRKASRVVSEGTKVESKQQKKKDDPEELLEEIVFPEDRITQQDTIHKFMPQNKATHSRVSSAVFNLTSMMRNNKIEEQSLENMGRVIKEGLTPSKFVYTTPEKEQNQTGFVLPKLSKQSWQKKVQREIHKGEPSFFSSNVYSKFGLPFENQYGMNLGNLTLTNLASENPNMQIRSNAPNSYFGGFGEQFLAPRVPFHEDNVTETTATKIPNRGGNNRASRLDALLNSFKYERVEEEGEGQNVEELTENGVLNPNVIGFEQNPFDEIFGDKVVQNDKKNVIDLLNDDQAKSKQSKAS